VREFNKESNLLNRGRTGEEGIGMTIRDRKRKEMKK
jgi:hypothetical protein